MESVSFRYINLGTLTRTRSPKAEAEDLKSLQCGFDSHRVYMNEKCDAERHEQIREGVIFHLRCELYKHVNGLHKQTLNDHIVIYFKE